MLSRSGCFAAGAGWLLLLASSVSVNGAEIAVLKDSATTLSLDGKPIEAWIDRKAEYNALSIYRSKNPETRGTSFGYLKHPVWLRIPFRNESSRKLWVLALHPRTLQKVEASLFDERGSLVDQRSYRIGRPGQGGSLDRMTPSFEWELPPGKRGTLVLKLQAFEQMGLDIRFITPERMAYRDGRLALWMGIYVGLIATLWFYTFFLYRSLRESFLRPYLVFIGSMLILVPSLNGAYDYALGRHVAGWFHFSDFIALTTALVCWSGTQFSRDFLQSAIFSSKLNRVQNFWTQVCLGAAFLSLPPFYLRFPEITGSVNDGVLVVTAILIVMAGVFGVRDRVPGAGLFLIAWLSFLVSVIIFLLSTHGWIANNVLTRSVVEVGNITEMLILAWAITGRVQDLERELIKNIQKALHSERMENLVKMICHDLSSPLQVVATHAQVGKLGGPASWEAVDRAVREQDQIVDFVRRHGSVVGYFVPGQLSRLNLKEVVSTLNFLFLSRARQKRVELRFPSEDQLSGLWVQAESASLIHSVLGNAISNAIKFSDPGSAVSLEVEATSQWVTLHIVDQGMGIPEALQEKLRARAACSSAQGVQRLGTEGETGTGYGMQLMKHFVESYGGEFRWESRAREDGFSDSGSRMTFHLKRVKA